MPNAFNLRDHRLMASLTLALCLGAIPGCGSATETTSLGACEDSPVADSIDRCNYLVGDSTFALLLDHSATPGNGDPGCGFRDDHGLVRSMTGDTPSEGCQIDWIDDTPEVPAGGVVVVGVSIHDAMCRAPAEDPAEMDCEIDTSSYADVVRHYEQFAPVVVVEVPPVDAAQNPTFAESANAKLAELNQFVAETLGCELIPYSARLEAPLYDGLHYIPGELTESSTIPLLKLGPDDACSI